MKILIDARLWGLENAGIGRYTINLIQELAKIDRENEYIILLRAKYYHQISLKENFTKVIADIPPYTIAEQAILGKIIGRYEPDVVHYPHFNIPVLYKGKFLVTIHDMLMHKETRGATTQPLPVYLVKHMVYKQVFRRGVLA